jgi:hypothetical protein
MARDLDHLELPQLQEPLPRQKIGGGGNFNRPNKSKHAQKVSRDAARVLADQRVRNRPPGVTPTLIFKLALHEGTNLDEDTLDKFGLTLVARDEDKTLVVFASDEDLAKFSERVKTYGSPTGYKYDEVGNIDALQSLTAEDRTGRRLALEPIEPGDGEVPVDVELWHPGGVRPALERVEELATAVRDLGGRQSDQFIGADLIVVRCHVNSALCDRLLEVDYVREVDRVPVANFERVKTLELDAGELPEIEEAPDDATGILILDSGIAARHPLLAPAVGDAQVFPASLGESDGLGPADGDQRLGGHGTAVAGFAVWESPHAALRQDPMRPQVALFSARVLDAMAEYDPDRLVEHQLTDALDYFLDNYPQCRVVSISLGDDRLLYRRGARQSRLAARIDELAYALAERDVLFVLCSGNFAYAPAQNSDHLDRYPHYLLDPDAALIEPATAALALTVGGLSEGGAPARRQGAAGRTAIGGTPGYPFPGTRAGLGVGGMVKPEFVAPAGDYGYDPAAGVDRSDPGLGLAATNRDFAPPVGDLMRSVAGTSFAAPAIAHQAALLFNSFPDASPNLIRALLADSARLPETRPAPFDVDGADEKVMRVFGYGVPDAERAAGSEENDVVLYAEGLISTDSYQLFELPLLPDGFIETAGDRSIQVSLAFDPPTRQTRGDSYLGLTMQFHMFRNATLEEVSGAFRDWKAHPAGPGEEALDMTLGQLKGGQKINFRPGATIRAKGTLQHGRCEIKRTNWKYEGGPLILAVSCLRKWVPDPTSQRYAVVLSLKHSDPNVRLHAPLQARLRPRQRARI